MRLSLLVSGKAKCQYIPGKKYILKGLDGEKKEL